jgi:acyl-CoA hydrolase
MAMENYKLVLPEHLNHHGFLFGGHLLEWVDEFAYIAASLDYPGCNLVTVALDKVEFRRGIKQGTILRFEARRTKVGRTSVQYGIEVSRGEGGGGGKPQVLFSTHVTYVRIDARGHKFPLPRK